MMSVMNIPRFFFIMVRSSPSHSHKRPNQCRLGWEHVDAHGGRRAKLGKPASKMAHTYQIHVQYSAFSEITYDNSTKY